MKKPDDAYMEIKTQRDASIVGDSRGFSPGCGFEDGIEHLLNG
jgi:hypothetical protein